MIITIEGPSLAKRFGFDAELSLWKSMKQEGYYIVHYCILVLYYFSISGKISGGGGGGGEGISPSRMGIPTHNFHRGHLW